MHREIDSIGEFVFVLLVVRPAVMGESRLSISKSAEAEVESLYPMCFGISCAFFALEIISEEERDEERLGLLRDRVMRGSAEMLGLLVWRVLRGGGRGRCCWENNKLENAQKELEELKQRRHEDARANEKVVGIFASQEQSWFYERKLLRQQLRSLANELRLLENNRDGMLVDTREKQLLLESMERQLHRAEEENRVLEKTVIELRETARSEAERHSSELWKHKTAFLELASGQRQIEAQIARVLKHSPSSAPPVDRREKHDGSSSGDEFSEQIRLKDEKLEALRWRMLSMELQLKRHQSQTEKMNRRIAQLVEENMKLTESPSSELNRESEYEEKKTVKEAPPVGVPRSSNNKWKNIIWRLRKTEEREETVAIEEETPRARDLSFGKRDLHSLGVAFKINRLKQQVLLMERRIDVGEEEEEVEGDSARPDDSPRLVNMVKKQIARYESLQMKADCVCGRMEESKAECSEKKTKQQRILESFLEEAFELQKHVVAAGQKLMEMHPLLHADIGLLLKDVQTGVELRLARIISRIEAPLALHGINRTASR